MHKTTVLRPSVLLGTDDDLSIYRNLNSDHKVHHNKIKSQVYDIHKLTEACIKNATMGGMNVVKSVIHVSQTAGTQMFLINIKQATLLLTLLLTTNLTTITKKKKKICASLGTTSF